MKINSVKSVLSTTSTKKEKNIKGIKKYVVLEQWGKMVFLTLFLIVFFNRAATAQSGIVTEQNLKDAILQRKTFTPEEMQELDVNQDGGVNVADLIYWLVQTGIPPSLIGEHIGILYRDGASLIAEMSDVFGQMPFALHITGESPLQGEINNTVSADNPLGHYSLYFPKGIIPVTFLAHSETGMSFEVEFETAMPNLLPDSTLLRKIVFSGEFDETKRILSGTYTETITGFKDQDGSDLPLTLTGQFMLVFGTSEEVEQQ